MLSDPDSIPLYILIAAAALFLNALLLLADTAIRSSSRSKIRQLCENDPKGRAARVQRLNEDPSRYRYTNRAASMVLVCTGAVSIWMMPVSSFKMRIIAIIIYACVMISLSYILPSKISRQHSEGIAMAFSAGQVVLDTILLPVTFILTAIANLFLVIFRQKTKVDEREFSEEDVMSMLEEGQESGAIMEEGKKMIGSIFQFDDELAYEIMTPRTDVFMIDINDPREEYMDEFMELRYSRIPVFDDEPDNIIGILYIKDFLIRARKCGFDNVDIRPILREPHFVPETKNIASLFVEMQQKKQHISILIDEYGGFSGIVTMEDIIEEIVGDIDDEYDEDDDIIEEISERTYLVDGSVSLDDLNEKTGTELDSDTSETVGGFIIDIIGEIPSDGYVNKTITHEDCDFTILSVKERRIERIKLYIKSPEEKELEEKKKAEADSSAEDQQRI